MHRFLAEGMVPGTHSDEPQARSGHGGRHLLALALVVGATATALSGCIVAPAYVEPAPVYYVAPRPVYVAPAPGVVYGRWGWRRY